MPATEQMTITLPKELAESVRAKVASGQYESESQLFSEVLLLAESDVWSDKGWGPTDEWLLKHALPALDELEANPASGVALEDVQEELRRRRELRRQQAA